jgi:hypothetical protein
MSPSDLAVPSLNRKLAVKSIHYGPQTLGVDPSIAAGLKLADRLFELGDGLPTH